MIEMLRSGVVQLVKYSVLALFNLCNDNESAQRAAFAEGLSSGLVLVISFCESEDDVDIATFVGFACKLLGMAPEDGKYHHPSPAQPD